MKFFQILSLCCVIFLSACNNEPQTRQAKFYAFGTEIDVSLFGVDAETADNTLEVLEQSFSNVNNTWHAWQPSTITTINNAIAEGQSIAISDDVAQLINLARSLAIDSHHLFNPAAGKLFELWGFHRDNWFESHPPPDQKQLDQWLSSAPNMEQINITNGILSSANLMVKLGFGGFAKGFAVDSAISALKKQGITNAIVNIGGDLRAIGSHGKRPWIIGIRHPRKEGMVASIALQDDESLFTSGDYERFFEFEGQRYPHIIDPRTAYPANQASSVTVLNNNASEADAAATALFVAGSEWPEIAGSMGINHVMLVRPDGQIELSPKMAERIRLIDNQTPAIIRPIEYERQ
ncbi:MAG: FAD:protein FMN transferase [Gammaproteobacteria bacterium]|nr:FAD:protein FMN transferase [Gammaproteobacteria bacterium]MDH5592568.1 FAD:protein FMN transferase [Gammaproteobacteria bacterium]